MLREMERMREPEPEVGLEHIRRLKERRALIYAKPRVLRWREARWHTGLHTTARLQHSRDRVPYEPIEQWGLPIYTMRPVMQKLRPGGFAGQHRHFFEAVFYVLQGRGYEIHDNVRYEWEAGDCMAVPTYAIHQHFNLDPDTEAVFFFVIPIIHGFLGLEQYEQLQAQPGYVPTEEELKDMGLWGEDFSAKVLSMRSVDYIEGEARTEYDAWLQLLVEENRRRKTVPHVIKPHQALPWEDTRMGRIKYMVHPKLKDRFATLTMDVYIQEIPPGSRSGKHLHFAEEVHYILEGQGYDIQDGVRYDWEKDDMVAIPVLTTHQHFNADPDKPARFVSVMPSTYRFVGHGGIHHLEDAPEYRP